MQDFPHIYKVTVNGLAEDDLQTSSGALPELAVAPPREFGGAGDQWSPEELLMASVANCLVLSFRAIARASRLQWESIECESHGELDRIDRKAQFTKIASVARLVVPAGESAEKAEKLLNKAEETCIISNSLSAESSLSCEIIVQPE